MELESTTFGQQGPENKSIPKPQEHHGPKLQCLYIIPDIDLKIHSWVDDAITALRRLPSDPPLSSSSARIAEGI